MNPHYAITPLAKKYTVVQSLNPETTRLCRKIVSHFGGVCLCNGQYVLKNGLIADFKEMFDLCLPVYLGE